MRAPIRPGRQPTPFAPDLATFHLTREDAVAVTLSDYLYASHTQTNSDCLVSFLSSRSFHKALTAIIVLLHRDLLYHCTIRSDSSIPYPCTITSLSVRYNLLLVQLSLVDLHLPLLSFTYISSYDEGYLNCTSRTLRP